MATFYDIFIPEVMQQGVLREFGANRLNFNPETGAFGETRAFMLEQARYLFPGASSYDGGINDRYGIKNNDVDFKELHFDFGPLKCLKLLATVCDFPHTATVIFNPITEFAPGSSVTDLLTWHEDGLHKTSVFPEHGQIEQPQIGQLASISRVPYIRQPDQLVDLHSSAPQPKHSSRVLFYVNVSYN